MTLYRHVYRFDVGELGLYYYVENAVYVPRPGSVTDRPHATMSPYGVYFTPDKGETEYE